MRTGSDAVWLGSTVSMKLNDEREAQRNGPSFVSGRASLPVALGGRILPSIQVGAHLLVQIVLVAMRWQ